MTIPTLTGFHPDTWSEDTWRVVRTMTALTGDGHGVDHVELVLTLMIDYNWSEAEAEENIEYAEYMGALAEGPAPGSLVQ